MPWKTITRKELYDEVWSTPVSKLAPKYNQLQHDIAETTRVKTSYVREAKSKENRFMTLLTGINTVFQDAALVELLVRQKLDKRPALAGEFRFEQPAATEERS